MALHNRDAVTVSAAVATRSRKSVSHFFSSPGRPVHSDTVLGFSRKHSSDAAITRNIIIIITINLFLCSAVSFLSSKRFTRKGKVIY